MSPERQRPRSLILENMPPGSILTSAFGGSLSQSVMTSSSTPATEGSGGSGKSPLNKNAIFIPSMEEVRVSAIVSKRGYLNVLEQKVKVC